MKQAGLFDVKERLARLSGLGDQLEVFFRAVAFEAFRSNLEKALSYSDGGIEKLFVDMPWRVISGFWRFD